MMATLIKTARVSERTSASFYILHASIPFSRLWFGISPQSSASNSWQSPYRLPVVLSLIYVVYHYLSYVSPSNTVYPVYHYISCVPIHVYPSNKVYPVKPYISCVPMFTLVIMYTLYILYTVFTHVYPSNTVNPVYPYLPCVPMFTLVILYNLYTLVYHVYPCLR